MTQKMRLAICLALGCLAFLGGILVANVYNQRQAEAHTVQTQNNCDRRVHNYNVKLKVISNFDYVRVYDQDGDYVDTKQLNGRYLTADKVKVVNHNALYHTKYGYLSHKDVALATTKANTAQRYGEFGNRKYMADPSFATFDCRKISVSMKNLNADQQEIVGNSLHQWERAGIHFYIVRTRGMITISNKNLPDKDNASTIQTIDTNKGYATHAKITADFNAMSPHYSRSEMINIIAHELGHALGLDHSSRPDSVMYPYNGNSPVSERDAQKVISYYKDVK